MIRVIIWGTGRVYSQFARRIQCGVELGEFEVVGVTSEDTWCRTIDGFPFLAKETIASVPCDFILVANHAHLPEIQEEYRRLGGDAEKLLSIDVLNIAGLSFPQYVDLYTSRISIIANNCWGGVTYHALQLPFLSPFINMFEEDDDYLAMAGDFRHRMSLPLEYVKDERNEVDHITYPVFSLGGALLHMNHYPDRAQAVMKWNERLHRMNWDNLFFMMYTERKASAERFDRLPYQKKVCFTSFPTDLPSAMYVKPYALSDKGKGRMFWETVLDMANGRCPYYDVCELLMHGKQVVRAS